MLKKKKITYFLINILYKLLIKYHHLIIKYTLYKFIKINYICIIQYIILIYRVKW